MIQNPNVHMFYLEICEIVIVKSGTQLVEKSY